MEAVLAGEPETQGGRAVTGADEPSRYCLAGSPLPPGGVRGPWGDVPGRGQPQVTGQRMKASPQLSTDAPVLFSERPCRQRSEHRPPAERGRPQ